MIEHDKTDATIEDIERALDVLLNEIIGRRGTVSDDAAEALHQALYARSGPALTRFKVGVELIIGSPIEGALRLSVRHIGERLFRDFQSPHKMMHLAKRVCSQDEINWSQRMTIIDAAWEGIGSVATGYWD